MGVTMQVADWLLLILGLGLLGKSYKACQSQLLIVWLLGIFERFWETPQNELRQAILWRSHWNWPSMQIGWSRVSGNYHGRVNSVSYVNAELRFVFFLFQATWVGGEFDKETMVHARASISGEGCLSSGPQASPCS